VPDDADQLTAVFDALATLALNDCICEGQPVLFGYKLADTGVTVTDTGWLPPPQAISNPSRATETHRAPIAEYFETFRPTRPTITTPATGKASGSHGERLSARC
jgi:hypothetical protein